MPHQIFSRSDSEMVSEPPRPYSTRDPPSRTDYSTSMTSSSEIEHQKNNWVGDSLGGPHPERIGQPPRKRTRLEKDDKTRQDELLEGTPTKNGLGNLQESVQDGGKKCPKGLVPIEKPRG